MATNKEKFVMPEWMRPFEGCLINTGGWRVEDLMNASDKNNLAIGVMKVSVESQLYLLTALRERGLLNEPATNDHISAVS